MSHNFFDHGVLNGPAYPQMVIRPIGEIKRAKRNARKHSKKQIAKIAASIEEFGFINPLLVDQDLVIIAGEGRLLAAQDLGMTHVPTLRFDHMTPEQVRLYRLADNRLAELGEWDQGLLKLELGELMFSELDLDLSLTGFEFPEIDAIVFSDDSEAADPLDETPEPGDYAVTQIGDVWAIGPHRLICGDTTQAETYAALLGDERAQMVFTDPPYNVRIGGHVSGKGKVKHREFAMGVGEMTKAEFTDFLSTVCRHLAHWSLDGSIHFQCIDWRHMGEMMAAGEVAYTELKNIVVWSKTNAGMGSFYRSQHEFVFVFKSGTGAHLNNVELGKHGRNRSNVWSYAGTNGFGATRDSDLAMHPTVKPVAMVADAILDCSKPKGIILDAFAGSGTTLVAAHKTKRIGYGIEFDPIYCDVILKRLAKVTKCEPIHIATGLTFAEIERQRSSAEPKEIAA